VTTAAAANSGTSRGGPPPGRDHTEVTMNRIRQICRCLVGLPRRASAVLASAAAAPAVLATAPPLPPGWNMRPPMPREYIFGPVVKVPGHTVIGGMPGWQITLIAAAAALLASALTVTVFRIRAARRRVTATTASAMTASSITASQQPEPTRSIPA